MINEIILGMLFLAMTCGLLALIVSAYQYHKFLKREKEKEAQKK